MANAWHKVCADKDLPLEDVVGVVVEGKTYAVYRLKQGVFATDGLCTHEQACLADGLVQGGIIECPKHNARFEILTGKAVKRPAKTDLRTYPTKVEADTIYIQLEQET